MEKRNFHCDRIELYIQLYPKALTELPEKRIDELINFLDALGINTLENINNLLLINEALTHTSSGLSRNYENLEFLGDAVLRLATTEFIDSEFSYLPVGEKSSLRAQLVSDHWLSNIGDFIGIHDKIIVGDSASRDKTAKTTLCAEATEALIYVNDLIKKKCPKVTKIPINIIKQISKKEGT